VHYRNPQVATTEEKSIRDSAPLPPSRVGLFRCLIVSTDPTQRELLRLAAANGGWQTILCADAERAMKVAERMALQLTIIDLEDADGHHPPKFDELQVWLSETYKALSIVCGNEGNVREEIWARQLGVWLYLPAANDLGGISSICEEARDIIDRLQTEHRPPNEPDSNRSRPAGMRTS
jgi:DNA-binding NtrC family response regulator